MILLCFTYAILLKKLDVYIMEGKPDSFLFTMIGTENS